VKSKHLAYMALIAVGVVVGYDYLKKRSGG